ncbi:MAG: FKBP-type peptidyl-prolyl cis-trans isomerase [Tannerellaceae bacterium]|nr:FKBP-type peptidyl-prolyl cis-trans isomerase [Tannerellaceae bacterium]
MDEVSYALGLSIGNNFLHSGIKDLHLADFSRGVDEALREVTPGIPYPHAKQLVNNLFTRLQMEHIDLNRRAGEEFLRVNRLKPGVKVLPSGLQYQILQHGEGKLPSANDKVKCHYHGTLVDGTVFDSSVERGKPAVFGVSQVIKGWTEALQKMPIGSKWRLFIPPHLAYGERGAGELIGPHTTLIFDVELLGIL